MDQREASHLQQFDEDTAYDLVQADPPRAVHLLIQGRLSPDVAFHVAEALGTIRREEITAALITLARAPYHPTVREGAVRGLGLRAIDGDEMARNALRIILDRDPDPSVRRAVGDVIKL